MKIHVYNNHATHVLGVAAGPSYSRYCEFVFPGKSAEIEVTQLYLIQNFDGAMTLLSNVFYDGSAVQHIVYRPAGTFVSYGLDYTGIPSTIEVPVVGEVTFPDWALTGTEAAVFFLGFAAIGGIRIFRAALRWFKRSSATTEGGHD